MREMKFKVWDINNKRMSTTQLDLLSSGELVGFDENDEIMQYTSLKDKNNKGIYEGDIVRFGRDNKIGLIIYCGDCFSIEFENDLKELHFHQHNNEIEVIGNMYENPEKLKTKDGGT